MEATAGRSRTGMAGRAATAALRAAAPVLRALLAYALLRAVGIALLAIFAHQAGRGVPGLLGRYDAIWYIRIATHGYDDHIPIRPNGTLAPTNLAFFPLYPGLIAALDPILPGDTLVAALTISWLAGLGTAWALLALGRRLRDERTGIMLAVLWAVLPHAVVESMAYTETLFTALATWSLVSLLRGRWLTTAVLCAAAGLARATAGALIVAVELAALVTLIQRRGRWRGGGWRPWVTIVIAPLGLLGYLAWVAARLGRPDAYAHLQQVAWGLTFDGGQYTVGKAWAILTQRVDLNLYVVTAVLALAIALFVLTVVDRQPWPLLVYSAVILVMTLGAAGYYHSRARLLLPAVTLLVPPAAALAQARPWTRVVIIALLAAGSGWYGAYLCLHWRYSP